jgi:hypothetical protein
MGTPGDYYAILLDNPELLGASSGSGPGARRDRA